MPDLGEQLNTLGSGMLSGTNKARELRVNSSTGPTLRNALTKYAVELAKDHGQDLDESAISGDLLQGGGFDLNTFEGRLRAFRAVAGEVANLIPGQVDPNVAAELRETVMASHGLEFDTGQPTPKPRASVDNLQPSRYIDTEFVAIYW